MICLYCLVAPGVHTVLQVILCTIIKFCNNFYSFIFLQSMTHIFNFPLTFPSASPNIIDCCSAGQMRHVTAL